MIKKIALALGMLAAGLSNANAICTRLSTGLQLWIPNFGDSGDVWSTCLKNDFTIINSSSAISSTTSVITSGWIQVQRISGISTGTAGIRLSSSVFQDSGFYFTTRSSANFMAGIFAPTILSSITVLGSGIGATYGVSAASGAFTYEVISSSALVTGVSVSAGPPKHGPAMILLYDDQTGDNRGGGALFGGGSTSHYTYFAGIRGLVTNGAQNTAGGLGLYTRAAASDAELTLQQWINPTGGAVFLSSVTTYGSVSLGLSNGLLGIGMAPISNERVSILATTGKGIWFSTYSANTFAGQGGQEDIFYGTGFGAFPDNSHTDRFQIRSDLSGVTANRVPLSLSGNGIEFNGRGDGGSGNRDGYVSNGGLLIWGTGMTMSTISVSGVSTFGGGMTVAVASITATGANGQSIITRRTNNVAATSGMGGFSMYAPNASGTQIVWGDISASVNDATAGSEDNSLILSVQKAGALTGILTLFEGGASITGGNFTALNSTVTINPTSGIYYQFTHNGGGAARFKAVDSSNNNIDMDIFANNLSFNGATGGPIWFGTNATEVSSFTVIGAFRAVGSSFTYATSGIWSSPVQSGASIGTLSPTTYVSAAANINTLPFTSSSGNGSFNNQNSWLSAAASSNTIVARGTGGYLTHCQVFYQTQTGITTYRVRIAVNGAVQAQCYQDNNLIGAGNQTVQCLKIMQLTTGDAVTCQIYGDGTGTVTAVDSDNTNTYLEAFKIN